MIGMSYIDTDLGFSAKCYQFHLCSSGNKTTRLCVLYNLHLLLKKFFLNRSSVKSSERFHPEFSFISLIVTFNTAIL